MHSAWVDDAELELGDALFRPAPSSEGSVLSSKGLESSSEGSVPSPKDLEPSSEGYTDIQLSISKSISQRKKVPKVEVEKAILELCSLEPTYLEDLHKLLNRAESGLRKDYLQPLLRERKLRYKFPTKPQHPKQAYITVGSEVDKG